MLDLSCPLAGGLTKCHCPNCAASTAGTCPVKGPRVLAVIATFLVRRVLWCGSLIGWFLRSIRCSGLAWRLGSSSMMLRLRPAVIASKAPAGWLRWAGSDLVEAGSQGCLPPTPSAVWRTPRRPSTCTRSPKLKSAGSTAFWLGWTTAPSSGSHDIAEATTRVEN
jgi:hypothetical protein